MPERSNDDRGAFVLVAEWAGQGPIVIETEGPFSSRRAAYARARKMEGTHRFTRWCVARLTYEGGNPLALADLERLQQEPQDGE